MSRRRAQVNAGFGWRIRPIRPGLFIARAILCLLSIALASRPALGELAPRFQWAEVVAAGRATLNALAVDDAHNSYVMGWVVHTQGPAAGIPLTNSCTFIAKYDAAGRLVHVIKDGNRKAEGRWLVVDGGGNLYVAYQVFGPVSIAGRPFVGQGARRAGTAVLAKYDPRGRPLWATLEPGPGAELITDLVVDRAGNCFWVLRLAGSRSVVTKYDPAGNRLWSHGAEGTANFRALAVDGLGNVYVSGGFSGELRCGAERLVSNDTAPGLSHLFLTKMSAQGEVLWARQSDGPRWEGSERIAADAAGNCAVFGDFEGGASFGKTTLKPGNAGMAAMFAARYDPDGNVLWAQLVGDGDGSGPKMIADDAGGNCYVAWLPGRAGRAEVTIAKYDPSGRNAWTRKGPVLWPFRIAADSAGYVYLAGEFREATASFDSLMLDNRADPSNYPGFCLGMLDTTSPPWQGLVNANPPARTRPPTFYMGPVQGFHPTNATSANQSNAASSSSRH